jgi:hypothetical protein
MFGNGLLISPLRVKISEVFAVAPTQTYPPIVPAIQ